MLYGKEFPYYIRRTGTPTPAVFEDVQLIDGRLSRLIAHRVAKMMA